MKYRSITRRAAGLAVLLAAVAAGSAQAAPAVQTSACSQPDYTFSQPFSAIKDSNWYTLAPGQSVDSFDGTGWTLTGGAKLVTTTLADGSTGTVLDLPAGAKAVSPPMCVSAAFPEARTEVRDLVGPPVHLYVSYTNTKSWDNAASAGGIPGNTQWSDSPPLQLHPGNLYGWQDEVFTLSNDSKNGDSQVYDFYLDPHCYW